MHYDIRCTMKHRASFRKGENQTINSAVLQHSSYWLSCRSGDSIQTDHGNCWILNQRSVRTFEVYAIWKNWTNHEASWNQLWNGSNECSPPSCAVSQISLMFTAVPVHKPRWLKHRPSRRLVRIAIRIASFREEWLVYTRSEFPYWVTVPLPFEYDFWVKRSGQGSKETPVMRALANYWSPEYLRCLFYMKPFYGCRNHGNGQEELQLDRFIRWQQ